MSVALALVSAFCFGVADFLGGYFSRRTSVWPLVIVVQLVAAVTIAALALFDAGRPTAADFGWAAAGAVANGIGTAALYRGLATGTMGVVAPVSGVGAAMIPVLIGFSLGERPSGMMWAGVLVAVPGIWLVARQAPNRTESEAAVPSEVSRSGLGHGLVAGVGFGLLFASLDRISATAGWLPLAVNELLACVTIAGIGTVMRARWLPTRREDWSGAAGGVLVGVATIAFFGSTQTGYLAVAAVLSSLYPAVTVLLAASVMREPVGNARWAGLGICLAAVGLVVAG
ncbi:MAG: EamA family transporter [Nocardioides sp.]